MQQHRHDSVVFMIRHYLTYAANVMLFSECYSDETKCDNGPCILKESLCDGKKDCTDNSDELNCSKTGLVSSSCLSVTAILSSLSAL